MSTFQALLKLTPSIARDALYSFFEPLKKLRPYEYKSRKVEANYLQNKEDSDNSGE